MTLGSGMLGVGVKDDKTGGDGVKTKLESMSEKPRGSSLLTVRVFWSLNRPSIGRNVSRLMDSWLNIDNECGDYINRKRFLSQCFLLLITPLSKSASMSTNPGSVLPWPGPSLGLGRMSRVNSWVSVEREVTPSSTNTGITAVLGTREIKDINTFTIKLTSTPPLSLVRLLMGLV